MDINDVLSVINTERAAELCLSKGGWEGWLQCELWRYLSIDKRETVEREVAYPGSRQRCDLLVSSTQPRLWVEIKAYGIFRQGDDEAFLDSIAADVAKLERKPSGDQGLALVVVPVAIGDDVAAVFQQRRWLGFNRANATYATVFTLGLA